MPAVRRWSNRCARALLLGRGFGRTSRSGGQAGHRSMKPWSVPYSFFVGKRNRESVLYLLPWKYRETRFLRPAALLTSRAQGMPRQSPWRGFYIPGTLAEQAKVGVDDVQSRLQYSAARICSLTGLGMPHEKRVRMVWYTSFQASAEPAASSSRRVRSRRSISVTLW